MSKIMNKNSENNKRTNGIQINEVMLKTKERLLMTMTAIGIQIKLRKMPMKMSLKM